MGIDFQLVRDSNDPGVDLKDRIGSALTDTTHDFIHVYTKVPDEATHAGDPFYKKDQISRLDRGLKELVQIVETKEDLLVVVTADHSTPSISPMIHSGEPVPVIMAGPSVRRDDVRKFYEIHAASGCRFTVIQSWHFVHFQPSKCLIFRRLESEHSRVYSGFLKKAR